MPRDRDPDKPSPVAHVIDVLTFRTIGVLLIAWEVEPKDVAADWKVVAAGFAMFFMPDALRGRSSVVWRLLERIFNIEEKKQ